jgi:hypothetical protein
MPGLLADVNVQGHLPYLERLIKGLDLLDILRSVNITFQTFADCGLNPRMKDRELWNYCQAHELVLFTDNRNHEDEDSLNATIQDSWQEGHLPVLTLANKGKFEHSESYASRVASDVATLLYSILHENVRNQSRIIVPL